MKIVTWLLAPMTAERVVDETRGFRKILQRIQLPCPDGYPERLLNPSSILPVAIGGSDVKFIIV